MVSWCCPLLGLLPDVGWLLAVDVVTLTLDTPASDWPDEGPLLDDMRLVDADRGSVLSKPCGEELRMPRAEASE